MLALLCSTGVAHAAPAETPPYRVAPPATWVTPLPVVDDLPEAARSDDSGGTHYLLLDYQTRVGTGSEERYLHLAWKVLSEAGLEDADDLSMSFDPSFERLTLHGLWRVRGGERRDILQVRDVKVLQKEEDLQSRQYNGELSVVPILRDVRVGDVVEVAYSIGGVNPVFGGRYADVLPADFSVPVVHWRERLLWPRERTLHVRNHGEAPAPVERDAGAYREYLWERRDLKPVESEDGLPSWYLPYRWVQLSEYATWGDVARWAAPLFRVPERSPALDAEVARLKAAGGDEEARFLAALRFVQDEVRYLGIEMGPNSHQPHPPEEVLERRYGDCKDKSLLLVTLLKGLGIDARVALVDTKERQALDDWQPTHRAFDHAIVLAKPGGRDVWVDPTRTLERGGLATLTPPAFRRALLVDPETRGLVTIPDAPLDAPDLFVDERYVASGRSGPGELYVVTRYLGARADAMRNELATTSRADLARSSLNFRARTDPEIRAAEPLSVKDEPLGNVITVREHYHLGDFWKDGAGTRDFQAHTISDVLEVPRIRQRTMPLAVAHPVHVRHRVTLEAPFPPGQSRYEDTGGEDGPAGRFRFSVTKTEDRMELDYSYRSLAEAVEPAKLTEHIRTVEAMSHQSGHRVYPWGKEARPREGFVIPPGVGWSVLAIVLIGGMMLYANSSRRLSSEGARSWFRRRAFARKFVANTGDSPQTALVLDGPEQLARDLSRLKCGCGREGTGAREGLSEESVVLGDRSLSLLRWKCERCGADRRAYVEVKGARAA